VSTLCATSSAQEFALNLELGLIAYARSEIPLSAGKQPLSSVVRASCPSFLDRQDACSTNGDGFAPLAMTIFCRPYLRDFNTFVFCTFME